MNGWGRERGGVEAMTFLAPACNDRQRVVLKILFFEFTLAGFLSSALHEWPQRLDPRMGSVVTQGRHRKSWRMSQE